MNRVTVTLLNDAWGSIHEDLNIIRYVVPHRCSQNSSTENDIVDFSVNATSVEYEECSIVVTTNGSDGDVVKTTYPCLYGNEYSMPRKISIVSEWDLVCDQEGYSELSQTVLNIGQMFGAVVCTTLADKFGRKPLYISCLIGLTVCGFGIAFSPSILVFIAIRFCIGTLQQPLPNILIDEGIQAIQKAMEDTNILGDGETTDVLSIANFVLRTEQNFIHSEHKTGCELSSYTMFVELFPTYHRALAVMISGLVWVTSLASLSGLAYLMRDFDWRNAQLIYGSVSIYVVVLYWTLDESVRWLLANGRLDEARRLISKAAKVNKYNPRKALGVLNSLIADQSVAISCSTESLKELREKFPDTETKTPLTLPEKENLSVENNRPQCGHKCGHLATKDDTSAGETRSSAVCSECLSDQIDGLEVNSHQKPLLTPEKLEVVTDPENMSLSSAVRETTAIASQHVYQKSINYTVLDLFRSMIVLRVTLIICYIWCVNSLTYYGLFLTSSSLVGDRFLNFFLIAIVETPSAVTIQFLYHKTGRKQVSIIFHVLAGVFLITSVAILGNAGNSEIGKIMSNVFNLLGKFAISASFRALFVYGPEVFPTNLRAAGMGISSAFARIGGMVAPYLRILSRRFIWGPAALFGFMCLLAAFLVMFLPETKGRELPTTIEEMEKSIVETAGLCKIRNKKDLRQEQE
ncbi:solute carrier family 22 member 8-like [Gigantopelta aegis]|uniref:solute carrier family 22 member 8-like n=1 Tax=Gigantopelta aegis TaxID=1735272 RepID=UPI001B88A78A|nr:solute carrier family 22 member 8-like [Gigantopelta aegis]